MVLFDNHNGCITPGFNMSDPAAQGLTIAIVSVPRSFGLTLLEHAGTAGTTISVEHTVPSLVDPGTVILWITAVLTVFTGAWWAGRDHQTAKRAAQTGQVYAGISGVGQEPEDVSITGAVVFVVCASVVLLLMFFFLNKAFFYVVMVFFCIAGIQAQAALYMPALHSLLPSLVNKTVNVPLLRRFEGPVPVLGSAAVVAAAAVSITWAVYRNAAWSWVLQDMQGVALCILAMRQIRLPNLKVACVLLPCLFFYDIFWVFLQPMLFGGSSVMVTVAKGGTSGELMPILLRVPRFAYGALGGYGMLGLGDIVLPGLLVALTARWDIDLKAPVQRGYFLPTLLAYAAGLVLTWVALLFSWFGDQGQPALLYLVPATLGTVFVVAGLRGEVSRLWRAGGSKAVADDHESDVGDDAGVVDVEAGRGGSGGGSVLLGPNSRGTASDERARLLPRPRSPQGPEGSDGRERT